MPEFETEPPHVSVVEQGSSVTVDCVAVGEPQPDVSWHRGTIQNTVHNEDRIMVLANNSLR
jgi:Immunoglobulin I-set domain